MRIRRFALERRLLIAFLLSTALILSYQFFYAGPRMRKAQELKRAQQERLLKEQSALALEDSLRAGDEDTAAREETPPETATSVRETDATMQDSPVADPSDAAFISVLTPLYEITLSTLGGEIISVRLLHWETEGRPVQLIRGDPAVDGGMLQVTLAGETQELALRHLLFEPRADNSIDPLPGDTTIELEDGERKLTFDAVTAGGDKIRRTYTFSADSYVIRAGVRYAAGSYPFAHDLVWSFGPGMRSTEKNTPNDYAAMHASVRMGDEFYRKKRGDFQEEFSGTLQWASLQMKYFTAIIIPEQPTAGHAEVVGVKDSNSMTASVVLPTAQRGGSIEQVVDVYFGPLDFKRLKTLGRDIEKNVEIGFNNLKIFKPVSVAILWSITWLHGFIPNYGLVIILISALTKVVFYRLTHKSFKSMRDMQALQPKLAALKEKYKDDRQKLSSETMRVYKEAGVNPLGGCLPMLLQMPVFIALFSVLRSTIEIRQAPFFGWISDLSQQDVLFELPFSLPVIGAAVSVLPILMGGSMFLQSKIGGSIAGPSSSTAQPKAFTYMLPVVFTFLFYKMPSGLVLYWLVNTVLSVAQQYYINKGAEAEKAGDVDTTTPTPPVGGDDPPAADKPARPKPARKGGAKRSKARKQRSKKG